MEQRHGAIRRLATFLAILAGSSALCDALLIASGTIQGKSSIFTLALMWSPALAALATARLFHDSWRAFGWRPGRVRYLAIAYLLPIIYCGVAYGLAWLTGGGAFTGNWPAYLPIFLVVGTLGGVISALGSGGDSRGEPGERAGLRARLIDGNNIRPLAHQKRRIERGRRTLPILRLMPYRLTSDRGTQAGQTWAASHARMLSRAC